MLSIKNLHVNVEGKEILKGLNLEVDTGMISALMGPNGSGKSTLAQALMGNPKYEITKGTISFNGKNIKNMSPDERSNAGIFLSFQYPSELTGVSVTNFLRFIYNKKHNLKLTPVKFREVLKEKMEMLDIKEDFLGRYLNEGFSGGEKKRMEMLQMLILEPSIAILDETDSGLDIDALKIVSKAVNYLNEKSKMGVLVITHYTRILEYLKPDTVHVLKDGRIVESGKKDLAEKLEVQGYAPFGE